MVVTPLHDFTACRAGLARVGRVGIPTLASEIRARGPFWGSIKDKIIFFRIISKGPRTVLQKNTQCVTKNTGYTTVKSPTIHYFVAVFDILIQFESERLPTQAWGPFLPFFGGPFCRTPPCENQASPPLNAAGNIKAAPRRWSLPFVVDTHPRR